MCNVHGNNYRCFSSIASPAYDQETARYVFTDATIKLTIQEVSMCYTI